ncbi:hypothetical protein GX441_11860 [bacterium]|nr:hypothetical protein [bacterium]
MYGFFVYPKEKFYEKIEEIPIEGLQEAEWSSIQILQCPDKDRNLKGIVTHIRNSLSHAGFSFETRLNFSFDDHSKKSTFSLLCLKATCTSLSIDFASMFFHYESGRPEGRPLRLSPLSKSRSKVCYVG